MFFKKKDDKKALPDLPPVQSLSLPKLPVVSAKPIEEEEESFPSSKIPELKKNPAISAREAVEDESELPSVPASSKFKAVEMEEWSPESDEPEESVKSVKIERAPEVEEVQESAPKFRSEKGADIFVKLDKFRSARRALEEIKIRTEEIDSLLKKIRDTKLREEQELTGWEKEITNIKSRVQDVSSNIFEKVE
jgi:hypothetical protein